MYCPFCDAKDENDTKVIDSRLVSDGAQVRRRRECGECGERFTTYEVAELVMPRVIKSDGRRDGFIEEKLRGGMLKALEKRPVPSDEFEASVNRIKCRLRACGEREIPSSLLGEWVMEELCCLDKVAYIRFASVYKNFDDMNAFHEVLDVLKKEEKME